MTNPHNMGAKTYKSYIWDSKIRKVISENTEIGDMATSKDGNWIASVSGNKVSLHNVENFKRIFITTQGGSGWINGIAFSPDSRFYAACGGNGSPDLNDIQIRDVENGKITYRYSNSSKNNVSQDYIAFSNSGKYIVGYMELGVIVYNAYYNTTRVDPIVFSDTLQVFPNPSNKNINVEIKDIVDYSFKVLNEIGQEFPVISNLENSNLEIDISNLENGTYFLVIKQKNISNLYKFIKE